MILENNVAFLEALEAVCDEEYESYLHSLDDREPPVFSEKHKKKMLKLISRQRKPYFKLISTAGRRAACIIVAIIVFSASAMSVKAIREAVFDFTANIFNNHASITFDSGTDEGYPTRIEREYYISELPDGFKQEYYEKLDVSVDIKYYNDDKYIFFSQFTKSDYNTAFDNEHTKFENIFDEKGKEYMLITTEMDITVIWDNGEYIFEITSNLDKDMVMDLCKSTKFKK